MAVENRAELASAPSNERGAGRVLRSRRDERGADAVTEHARELVRNGPFIVDPDRHRDETERRYEIEHAGEARVLDRDPIARPEMRRSTRSMPSSPPETIASELVDAVRAKLTERFCGEGGQLKAFAVEARRCAPIETRQRRQQARIGIPVRQVPQARGRGGRRDRRQRWTVRDPRSLPSAPGDHAAHPQPLVRGGDRRRADAEPAREIADGRELRSRAHRPSRTAHSTSSAIPLAVRREIGYRTRTFNGMYCNKL